MIENGFNSSDVEVGHTATVIPVLMTSVDCGAMYRDPFALEAVLCANSIQCVHEPSKLLA